MLAEQVQMSRLREAPLAATHLIHRLPALLGQVYLLAEQVSLSPLQIQSSAATRLIHQLPILWGQVYMLAEQVPLLRLREALSVITAQPARLLTVSALEVEFIIERQPSTLTIQPLREIRQARIAAAFGLMPLLLGRQQT